MMQRLANSSTSWGQGMDPSYPKELIRGFLQHAVEKVTAMRSDISGVIVLADEVLKAEDEFVIRYDLKTPKERDVTAILRSALLDEEFVDDVDFGLVISTLGLSAAGLTWSSRFVIGLI
eukprot:1412537-Amphidinium_carterae.1